MLFQSLRANAWYELSRFLNKHGLADTGHVTIWKVANNAHAKISLTKEKNLSLITLVVWQKICAIAWFGLNDRVIRRPNIFPVRY